MTTEILEHSDGTLSEIYAEDSTVHIEKDEDGVTITIDDRDGKRLLIFLKSKHNIEAKHEWT